MGKESLEALGHGAHGLQHVQVRRHHRPPAMAALRNIAISLLRLSGARNVAAATRYLGRQTERPLRLLGL